MIFKVITIEIELAEHEVHEILLALDIHAERLAEQGRSCYIHNTRDDIHDKFYRALYRLDNA